jgi:uncharacterized protein YuzE
VKLYYYADTDSLYIDLADRPSVTSREVLPGVVLHLDDGGALVGIAAMHFAPNSTRYSDDLDFFHDSEARVAAAFTTDRSRLQRHLGG